MKILLSVRNESFSGDRWLRRCSRLPTNVASEDATRVSSSLSADKTGIL